MSATLWFVVVGALLVVMGVATGSIRRLPLTTAIIYFVVGYAMDPAGVSFAALDPVRRPVVLERVTEIVVLVSLFTAGLKLRAPFGAPAPREGGEAPDRRWLTPLRLATVSMVLTVAMVTALGHWGLGLPLGAAVLLGGILAPTDPVLAADVQVEHAQDRDRLRFALTGEAGLNDGTAFPVVMLGLGLLGLHDLGDHGWRWLAVDVVWASAAGLGVGWLLGTLVGRLALRLRHERAGAVVVDDLLALGLIALANGVALSVKGYGFLAVFAAALAFRRAEERYRGRPVETTAHDAEGGASREPDAHYMTADALGVAEQLERIGEAGAVLLLGGLFATRHLTVDALWFVPALFLVVRPLAVWLGTRLRRGDALRRRLVMWFGIRGIGSIYYLSYASAHGLPAALAERLTELTFTTVVVSLFVHGVSVTPLMRRYRRRAVAA